MRAIENSDQKLMQGLAKNEAKAFESLYLMYGRKLFVFINSYLSSKDETEEIVQEVFIKVWKNRNKLNTSESLKGYLFTIAYNAIRKRFVNKKREDDLKKEFLLDQLSRPDDSMSEDAYRNVIVQIESIVEQMPDKRRQVFKMCKNEGLSVPEVAAYLKVSEKTVKNQMTSAYQFIREQLKNNMPLLLALNLFY